jgi:hypothetical protein
MSLRLRKVWCKDKREQQTANHLWPYSRQKYEICPKEYRQNSVRLVGIPAHIRTRHLLNCYSKALAIPHALCKSESQAQSTLNAPEVIEYHFLEWNMQ